MDLKIVKKMKTIDTQYLFVLPTDVLIIILEFVYEKYKYTNVSNYMFHRSIEQNHYMFTRLFVENKIQIENSNDDFCLNPIHKLCSKDSNLDTLKLLLSYTPNQRQKKELLLKKSKTCKGLTALHIAAYHNCIDIVKFILDFIGHKAVNQRTYLNRCLRYCGNVFKHALPLDFALTQNHKEIIELLLPMTELDLRNHTYIKGSTVWNTMPSFFYSVHYSDDCIFETILRESLKYSHFFDRYSIFKISHARTFEDSYESYSNVIGSAIEDTSVHEDRVLRLLDCIKSSDIEALKKQMEPFVFLIEAIINDRYRTCHKVIELFGKAVFFSSNNYKSRCVLQNLCNPSSHHIETQIKEVYNKTLDFYCSDNSKHIGLTDESKVYPIFIKLIETGIADELISSFNKWGYSVIHYAAFYGMERILRKILEKYPETKNFKTRNGQTALHLAVIGNHFRCVEVLLEHNVILECLDRGNLARQRFTPLLYAMGCSDFNIAKILINAGANVHIVTKNAGLSLPIEIVKRAQKFKIAIKLFELVKNHAVYLNHQDANGMNPLHWAVTRDRPELVTYLLKSGINGNAETVEGMTPLMIACRGIYRMNTIHSRFEIVRELLRIGVDVFKTNFMGDALSLAKDFDEFNDGDDYNVYTLLKTYIYG